MAKDKSESKQNPEPTMNQDEKIERLEMCLAKMAHYSGTNRILDEFNIDRWEPGKDDMRKYKG